MAHALMQGGKYSLYKLALNNSQEHGHLALPRSGAEGKLGQGACLAPWSGTIERVRPKVPAPGPQTLSGVCGGDSTILLRCC